MTMKNANGTPVLSIELADFDVCSIAVLVDEIEVVVNPVNGNASDGHGTKRISHDRLGDHFTARVS